MMLCVFTGSDKCTEQYALCNDLVCGEVYPHMQ